MHTHTHHHTHEHRESIDAGLSSPITTADALTKALQGDYIAMFLPGGDDTFLHVHITLHIRARTHTYARKPV